MADEAFHNPYHFVPHDEPPAQGLPEPLSRTDAETFRSQGPASEYAHNAYTGLSGRILCRLTTETPLVVGGNQKQSSEDYTLVEPYTFCGEPTIPATSLKGVLSSIIEAASQSAMRVFEERNLLSYRQPMDRALSALGIIERDPAGDGLVLRPLTAPNLTRSCRFAIKPVLWQRVFRDYVNVKVYIGSYNGNPSEQNFIKRLAIRHQCEPRIPRDQPYYMKVWKGGPLCVLSRNPPFASRMSKRGNLVIAQEPSDRTILTEEDYRARRERGDDVTDFVRGFIRVLGIEDRTDIPNSKNHELFLPDPDIEVKAQLLPIPVQVLAAFHAIAAERADEQNKGAEKRKETLQPRQRLPYLPFGEEREEVSDRPHGVRPELQPGHIVYFDVDADGAGKPCVSALSFSSIWRDAVSRKDRSLVPLSAFFDAEKLPFSSDRTTVSPAEWLFGFVSASEKSAKDQANNDPGSGPRPASGAVDKPTTDKPYSAYRGRVRITAARLANPKEANNQDFYTAPSREVPKAQRQRKKRLEGHVRLRTLGSPKPPSPQMYFVDQNNPGHWIAKEALSLDKHKPQGRKFYLHQHPASKPWETILPFGDGGSEDEELKQARLRNAVKPIAAKRSFWFHVDFDNLSEQELSLLCFALRPSEEFRHKIGMGKSLGLGSIRIDPQALFLIERAKRYQRTTGLFRARRYDQVVMSREADRSSWPERLYAREIGETMTAPAGAGPSVRVRADACRDRLQRCYPKTIKALLIIGESARHHQTRHVHTPLTKRQRGDKAELETFKWFTENAEHIRCAKNNEGKEKKQWKKLALPQQLPPIDCRSAKVPVLRRNESPVTNPECEGTGSRAPGGHRGPRRS